MKHFISGLLLAISLINTDVQADSQVVYSCSKESSVYGDSQVVYNLAGFNSAPDVYCQVKDLIEQALVDKCRNVFEFGRKIVLKSFQIDRGDDIKDFSLSNLLIDLEVEVEDISQSSDKLQKSLSLESVRIKFETHNKVEPTLENLKVVDISSSGVCK